ncbi:MAG: PQQ-dependent sugar dehydrogenase [Rhodobacteraceae bacterium]|nr:PQQ-dependent sugar dehydrogenase [Paracoccaceae bacterium]
MERRIGTRGSLGRSFVLKTLLMTLALAMVSPVSVSNAAVRNISSGPVVVDRIAGGLRVPWSIAFLPNCEFLVTERRGRLYHFDASLNRTRVSTNLRVFGRGQGGLLDVMAARDFERTRRVYLTYAYSPGGGTAGTAISAGRLAADNSSLESLNRIFEASPRSSGSRHFGSRIVEADDGSLYATIGERGRRSSAQDLSSHNGSVIRIWPDGSVPSDNPFVGQEGRQWEIWSYGHRNAQGATFDAAGNLWLSEHGARGGDEVNLVERGLNYGWPVISYGRHYSGLRIGEGHERAGMEQPEFYWDPSIAPSGIVVYSGKLWPEWKDHILVGSLKFDMISRLGNSGGLREVERISMAETQRVRDVREAQDGSIWFISEDLGAIYRMIPRDVASDSLSCH